MLRHYFILIISAELLAVGSLFPHNVKTEVYSTKAGTWKTLNDYQHDWESKKKFASIEKPFFIRNEDSQSFGSYAALYHESAFYLFGGESHYSGKSQTHYQKKIERLDTQTNTWSRVGCPPKELRAHPCI